MVGAIFWQAAVFWGFVRLVAYFCSLYPSGSLSLVGGVLQRVVVMRLR